MAVDPETFFQGIQPPTASDPAGAEGQAPPVSPPAAPEPGQQTEGQEQQPEVDFRAQAEKYRKEAEANAQRAAQHEQKIQQFQQGLEQVMAQQAERQRQQQRQARIDEALARADTMRSEDAKRYLKAEMQSIEAEYHQSLQQERQQWQMREQQIARTLGAPLYIEKLVKDHGLPAEAKERLMAYGDPELAERVGVPMLRDYYEQKKQWEEQLKQAARSQEAQNRAQSGLSRLGGNNPPSTPSFEVPDNLSPEQRALWIYDNVIHGG